MAIQLSVVVPMYNEARNIEAFFAALLPTLERVTADYEVICVNDGSEDQTLKLLKNCHSKNPRIKILDLSRNFGKEAAMSAGLNHAAGDAVIPIDSDLQDPPELIPQLVDKWRQGYQVVLCERIGRRGDSRFKRYMAGLFYRFNHKLSDISIPVDIGDYRLMDRQVVEALKRLPERTRFMKGLFAWVGYEQTRVGYIRPRRISGSTKWSFWKLWNFALDGIFSFSTLPLRIWTYMGLLVACAAALYMFFIVIKVLIMGIDVPGYASTLVFLLFFSGLNMIGLGILGEYVGRIFTEVKRRPLYLINRKIGMGDEPDPVRQPDNF